MITWSVLILLATAAVPICGAKCFYEEPQWIDPDSGPKATWITFEFGAIWKQSQLLGQKVCYYQARIFSGLIQNVHCCFRLYYNLLLFLFQIFVINCYWEEVTRHSLRAHLQDVFSDWRPLKFFKKQR